MKRIGCKMMVIALAMAMLFTGCNEAVNEEMLTTESETTALESEFVERSEDMVVESQDTELVEVEESEEKSSKEEVTKMEETKTENSKTETTEKKSTNSESSEVVLAPTEDKTSELVTGVINQIITGEMSELEKAKAIHDWMVMNIDYDYQNYINNTIPTTSWHVDGVLTTRYAICDGYAKTFKALCEAAGLECEYVSGNTTEDELKAEILRIKAIPEYTTMEHGIFVTKDFLEQTGYLSTIEKWLYFDAGLVMECNTYSPQGANIYKARAKFRPVTPLL